MLYIIGGPAKVGKSNLAQAFNSITGISYFPLDAVTVSLKENGQGLFNEKTLVADFDPYFKSLLKHLPYLIEDICIEGNAFTPESLHKILAEEKIDAKVCFLGMSSADLKTILNYAGPETWLITDLTEEERQRYPEALQRMSSQFKEQCTIYNFNYFDMAEDYDKRFKEALQSLAA